MSHKVNIAIANVTLRGFDGSLDNVRNLWTDVVNRINPIQRQLNDKFDWIEVWGPDQIGTIEGDSQDSLQKNIEDLAKKKNVDILIYGFITFEQSKCKVVPAIYISPRNLPDAEEISGHYEVSPIYSESCQNNIPYINRLDRFAEMLAAFIDVGFGLGHYTTSDYEKALETFSKVEKKLDTLNGATAQSNPDEQQQIARLKQITFLLEGNAAGRVGEMKRAESAYQSAIKLEEVLNFEYARPRVGLASIYYMQGMTPTINSEWLVKSLDLYKKAEEANKIEL